MPKDIELKARDKVTQKMTRDGAVEENLTEKTSQRVSDRISDITFDGARKNVGESTELEFGRGMKEVADKAKPRARTKVAAEATAVMEPQSDSVALEDVRHLNEHSNFSSEASQVGASNAQHRKNEAYLDSLLEQVGVKPDSRFASMNMQGNKSSEGFSESKIASDRLAFVEGSRVVDGLENEADTTAVFEEEDNSSPLKFEDKTALVSEASGNHGAKALADKAAYKKHIQGKSARQIRNEEKAEQNQGALGKKLKFTETASTGVKPEERAGKTTDKTSGGTSSGNKIYGKNSLVYAGTSRLLNEAESSVHQKIQESEDENVGVQAAHESELVAESIVRRASSSIQGKVDKKKIKKNRSLKFDDELDYSGDSKTHRDSKTAKETKTSMESSLASNKAVSKDNLQFEGKHKREKSALITSGKKESEYQIKSSKAITKSSDGKEYYGRVPGEEAVKKSASGNKPKVETSKDASKNAQKAKVKKSYAASYRKANGTQKASKDAVEGTSKAIKNAGNKAKEWVISFVKNHKGIIAIILACLLLFIFISAALSSCGAMISETGGSFVNSTFLSSDDAITGVDAAYVIYEDELQSQIDNIESTHSGYDEYRYQVDEISHDPYALASFLTAYYGNYKQEDVSADLINYFREQYTLTLNEVVEIRTRTVTVTDPDTGETSEEEEEYEWYVLEVSLDNAGIETVAMNYMNENQKNLYQCYMTTSGNRSYLFGDTQFAGNPSAGGLSYEIPPEALEDEAFARMIEVGEQFLGRPYVWAGSSPSTGFDCSGFVSWVINNSGNGWNVGRQSANGLMSNCTYVSPSNARPGDLIFFEHTYNTSGASHVGIYVGDGMMLHCGDPIQYTSINSNYWQSHFLSFGRLNN